MAVAQPAAAAGSTSTAPPQAATKPSIDAGAASSPDIDPDDAGASQTPPRDADGGVSSGKRQECDADLAACLIADPLGFDVCLRKNAEQGCPEAETTGTTTTTPVLDQDGNPISQVCQAELAKCIMRLPTPENAAECTEVARKCK